MRLRARLGVGIAIVFAVAVALARPGAWGVWKSSTISTTDAPSHHEIRTTATPGAQTARSAVAGAGGALPGATSEVAGRIAQNGRPRREPAAHAALDRGAREQPPADPTLTPAQLDRARPEQIRALLEHAVEEAQARRDLAIAPEILAIAAEEGSVRVVFAAEEGNDVASLARILVSGGRSTAVEDLRVFPLLGHAAAKLSPGALFNLIRETATSQIELDAPHSPSLLQSVPQIGADLAHQAEHDGDGFAVAVIDTGIDLAHPMFAGRVIEEACFSVGSDCPNGSTHMLGAGAAASCALPGCDHGTHVAGIALGDLSPDPLVGVAPHARLIAINVFSDSGGEAVAYTSDLLAAMQHVLALSAFHAVAAVNLSLGGQAYTSSQSCNQASPSQVNAIARLRSARIATVAAAGNDGFTNAVSSPACLSNAISVGSVGDLDTASTFSNSADFLDVLAPGETILSAAVGGGTRLATGTSMAAPHVAGAIAAVREAVPNATVDEIENALVLSGAPILDARNGITKPRIRVDQAITMLETAGGGGGDVAPSSSSGGGGSGCGLVGLEPFLVLALVRVVRRRARR